jgi:hypothetical protein
VLVGLDAGLVVGFATVFGAAFAVDLNPVLAVVLVAGFVLVVLPLAEIFMVGLTAEDLVVCLTPVLGAVLVVPWAKPMATQPTRRRQTLILLRISRIKNKVLSTLVPYFLRKFRWLGKRFGLDVAGIVFLSFFNDLVKEIVCFFVFGH